MSNLPNSVPHPGWERFESAVADVEAAMSENNDAQIRETIIALGWVAFNISHGISASLRHTARISPRLSIDDGEH